MAEHRYAVTSGGFNMWLAGEHVQAKDMVFTVNDEQNEELQKLMRSGKRSDITRELTYIDISAAEKIAKDHQVKQPPAAHQGGAHSGVGKLGVDKPKNEKLTEITPKEPAGMTLKERIAANRENVLANLNVQEEGAIHAEEAAPPIEIPSE
jgi:hypothetical protein